MNIQKTAILVDSGTDIPQEYIDKYSIYVVPLMVVYSNKAFRDGIDITPQQVYNRLKFEIPRTSMPNIGAIREKLAEIQKAGYKKVLLISISSGLSGTNHLMKIAAKQFPNLDCRVIDTKNIGIAAGMTAILAAQYLENGMRVETVEKRLKEIIPKTKVYFCVNTLEYLRKGGRISLFASMTGEMLGVKPIISCDEKGMYYMVKKVRGRVQSIKGAIEMACKQLKDCRNYNIAVAHGNATQEAEEVLQTVKKLLPQAKNIFTCQISPSLVVHTGPGLVGIAVQPL